MPNLPLRYKNTLVANGYKEDPQQEMAVGVLQSLLQTLMQKKSWSPFSKKEKVRGIYIYGGVGRGKSMLMDLFYDELPESSKKRRVHFHQFMIETHDWLHAHRGDGMDDLLPAYAEDIVQKTKILCFDEFHVTDVADAMILGRLFTALLDKGVVVVSTSNWAPDDLYKGGLQRELFLPFIKLLKERMTIVHLDHDIDYRLLAAQDQDMFYFYPLHRQTGERVERLFSILTAGQKMATQIINVKGREIIVRASKDIARFSFAELCEQPLGAEDYITIARQFHTVFVENVPVLSADKRNEAKRFILLIDCLYEAGCRLVISAQTAMTEIYHGHDHAFEFDRTISRLNEMQSDAYHEKHLLREAKHVVA